MNTSNKRNICLFLIVISGCSFGIASFANKNSHLNRNELVKEESETLTQKTIEINQNLFLLYLAPDCYLYTAWADIGSWGRIGSNGLVIVNEGKALLIDAPVHESQMIELAEWFAENLDVKFELFVPGHWHDDCVGGMAWLHRNGVKSFANLLTNKMLLSKGKEAAKESFSDSLKLEIGNLSVEFYYLGGGHSTDNIVAWIPSEKILFGGCMVKDMDATNIGNTSDAAPLKEWFQTIERAQCKFPDAKIIIPGHGNHGGRGLFEYTKTIIQNAVN